MITLILLIILGVISAYLSIIIQKDKNYKWLARETDFNYKTASEEDKLLLQKRAKKLSLSLVIFSICTVVLAIGNFIFPFFVNKTTDLSSLYIVVISFSMAFLLGETIAFFKIK